MRMRASSIAAMAALVLGCLVALLDGVRVRLERAIIQVKASKPVRPCMSNQRSIEIVTRRATTTGPDMGRVVDPDAVRLRRPVSKC
jgi:hypothetical protein